MDSHRNPEAVDSSDDLSALAWVHDELRRSLEAATKALRRFVKETEATTGSDVDSVDPAVLRTARQQIHQGVGALELVGLPAAATMLRACESAVQRFVAKPHKLNTLVVDDLERASFALLDYLNRVLAGKTVSPLALFPQYRAVQEAAGAERVHPADLWSVDWHWHALPDAGAFAAARQPDAAMHSQLEQQMLATMRGNATLAAARMSDLCAGLGAGAKQLQISTLWKLASAVFEAQAKGLLPFDVFSKRVAPRLLSQFRGIERGETDVSERLAQDLLFFCAQASSPTSPKQAAPRLASVRAAYGLGGTPPVDYSVSLLGKFDPAWIVQAKKRVSAAKESWSAVAGGELHRMGGLSEQFTLVGDSLRKLFPGGEVLATELQQAVAYTQHGGAAPSAPLAMEVATGLLYIEASLEDAEYDNPAQEARVRRLAERTADVRQGAAPKPLEGWMEDLYRRVSDRQTMGSVVQELRASLSEVEKLIDQFFRKPTEREVLIPVPGQLSSMRGVLSVLGMNHASAALLRMRDDVDGLATTDHDPAHAGQAPVFGRLAANLGALGFLIDMLSVQPAMAKSLFTFDAEQGMLNPVMGRATRRAEPAADAMPSVEPRLIEQAQQLAFSAVSEDVPVETLARDLQSLSEEAERADQPALLAAVQQAQTALEQAHGEDAQASVRGDLSDALVDFVHTASEPVGLAAESAPLPFIPEMSPPAVSNAPAELAEDDEMREIFLEEAREVLQSADEACSELAAAPADVSQMTTLRRAYHTLKGSSRMVGLKAFGDAAWSCEQLYNTRLADQQPADQPLLGFTRWSLGYLAAWVDAIAARKDGGHQPSVVEAAVAALSAAPAVTEAPVVEEEVEASTPAAFEALAPAWPADLPTAADLDLRSQPTHIEPAPVEEAPTIELDLSAFDLAEPGVPSEPLATEPAAVDSLGVSLDADAWARGFDTTPAELVSAHGELPPADESVEMIEIDLGAHPTEPAPLIDSASLAPEIEASHEEIDLPLPDMVEAQETPQDTAAFGLSTMADGFDAELPPGEPVADEPVAPAFAEEDQVKVVGPLRISIPLFNIFLTEADELSRRLTTEIAEWAMELHRPVGETAIALAHSLAGSSATVGFSDLSHLARTLEHALMRSQAIASGTPEEGQLFVAVAEEIRRLLHQFAAGFLKTPAQSLFDDLATHEVTSARRLEAATAAAEARGPITTPSELAEPETVLDEADTVHAADVDMPDTVHAADAVPTEAGSLAVEEPVVPAVESAAQPVAEPVEPASTVAEHVEHVEPVLPEPVVEPEPAAPAFADSAIAAPPADSTFDALGAPELKPLAPLQPDVLRAAAMPHEVPEVDDDIDAVDAVDAELFPIFEEEALELLPKLDAHLRSWAAKPADPSLAAACMRTLHTLKGGARLAGAMRLGEMAHRLEGHIEALLAKAHPTSSDVDALHGFSDQLTHTFDLLRSGDEKAYAEALAETEAALRQIHVTPEAPKAAPVADAAATKPAAAPKRVAAEPAASASPLADLPAIDWSRFASTGTAAPRRQAERATLSQAAVRVRAPLLDRMVNQAGEVSITRSRIESEVGQIKASLGDLTDNLERLRQQLRDIELQAETQMSSRLEQAKAASQTFDPLEFDRFTRFQELTRMMAESVNDVATVQRTLQRTLETTEDELVAQARLTRDLQDDLLRTRMVEFESMSDRLYRVVRQAAKETGKQVRLDIVGGSIEVDRGVLDRMTGAFEHLLRNSVTHGVESPETRTAAGKDAAGNIVVALTQEGNEVGVEFRDDGGGLDLDRIRNKAHAMGLVDANAPLSDADAANLIFTPGFSTADTVTELAGRGVGMDVVRSEVNAMGGRIETATSRGQGTSFKLVLPLTTAVTQVVMMRIDDAVVAVPSTLIEIVRRATVDEVAAAYQSGSFMVGDRAVPFFWLGSLLHKSAHSKEPPARVRQVLIIRSAQQRIALHVDEVLGNQEVVVKNLGPQLSRMPGLAGLTLLASGAVALIYNPVALATLYGVEARNATFAALQASVAEPERPVVEQRPAAPQAPLVLVVDDSLTVRRVTQRLLVREGYRVTLAKDGLDALERLAEEKPQMVLSDIEMPRMDGFDLVRNIRGDARLRDLPVIMITSRIAQKHRDYAAQLGVDHYLGKPYSEEDLLALIGRYTAAAVPA